MNAREATRYVIGFLVGFILGMVFLYKIGFFDLFKPVVKQINLLWV